MFKDVTCDAVHKSISFKSIKDGKSYCVSVYDSIDDKTEYGTSDAYDVLVLDISKLETTDSIDGFKLIGKTASKSFYVEERFVIDNEFNIENTVMPEWENLFCSFEMSELFCDEYDALKNTAK